MSFVLNKINNKIRIEIGIPRAMSYYNNYPFYYGFFTTLGVDIILSDKTTSATINTGAKYVVSDTCLPIKVYVGHIINLLDKGCDTIFVPSLQSTGYKINNCSKVRGLPEIIRNVIDRPFKMIEPTLDKTEGIGFEDFCIETAKELGITDINLINSAIANGWGKYNHFIRMTKSGIPYQKALQYALADKYDLRGVETEKEVSVVIVGHGYNIFDERISLNLIKKLERMNVKVYTSLNVSKKEATNAIHELDEIQYWANELDVTGVAAHFMLNKNIDGIIALSAFGCGPDSLMIDEIAYHAEKYKLPLLHLNIDEHTGEAGFMTRIEAFVDMLVRKRRQCLKKQKRMTVVPIKTTTKSERVLTLT